MSLPDTVSNDTDRSDLDDVAAEVAERSTAPPPEPRPGGPSAIERRGKRLRQLRDGAGLSQREVAERVGIDVTYLSKLENGKRAGSERVLRALADVFPPQSAELQMPAPRLADEVAPLVGESPPATRPFGPP